MRLILGRQLRYYHIHHLVTMNKNLAIATVLMAATLTGILSTNAIAFAQDESETDTEQEIKQKNVGSCGEINQQQLCTEFN